MTSPDSLGADRLRVAIVTELDLEAFPLYDHRDRDYLQRALDAGFTVSDLATAHDVNRRTIYRSANRHGIDLPRPPANGLARRLWELDADAIGSDA